MSMLRFHVRRLLPLMATLSKGKVSATALFDGTSHSLAVTFTSAVTG